MMIKFIVALIFVILLQGTELLSGGAGVHENPSGTTVYGVAKSSESTSNSNGNGKKNLVRYQDKGNSRYAESITHGNVDVAGGITYNGTSAPIVEYKESGGFSASMAELAASPDTSWISDLAANPLSATFVGVSEQNARHSYKQGGFTREFVQLGGIVASIASAGTASGLGLAAVAATGLEGTVMGVAMQQGIAAGASGIASRMAAHTLARDFNIGRAAKDTVSREGLKGIAASSVTAGVTGGVMQALHSLKTGLTTIYTHK